MSNRTSDVYTRAGVDIAQGNALSALAAQMCAKSWGNNPFINVTRIGSGESFRGPRVWDMEGLPSRCKQTGGMDGNGTKPIITVANGWGGFAGSDLVAMLAGDITSCGGMPALMWDEISAATLDKSNPAVMRMFGEIVEGIGAAAQKARVAVFGGEVAEMGVCVGSENPNAAVKFNLSGCMVGYVDPERLITGERMRPGMAVMALQEFGIGCNWVSSVRLGLRNHFGNEWYDNPDAQEMIKAAAVPCEIYDYFLTKLNGWHDAEHFTPLVQVHGIAHLTGGGIKDRMGELLAPFCLSAELTDLWRVPDILAKTVEWTDCPQEQFYAGSGGGQRLMAVIDEADVAQFIQIAERCWINAKQCGVVTTSTVPTVQVKSGLTGEMINYTYPPTNAA